MQNWIYNIYFCVCSETVECGTLYCQGASGKLCFSVSVVWTYSAQHVLLFCKSSSLQLQQWKHPVMCEEYVCAQTTELLLVLILFFLSSISACLSLQESCEQLMPAGDWKVWADVCPAVLLRLSLPLSFLCYLFLSVRLVFVVLAIYCPSSFFVCHLFVLAHLSKQWRLPESTEKRKTGRWEIDICNFTRLNITKMIITTLR